MTRKKCICQICMCGRHHCPHKTTSSVMQFDEAAAMDPGVKAAPPMPLKREGPIRPKENNVNMDYGEPTQTISTARGDYPARHVEPVQRVKNSSEYHPPTEKFEGKSSYKENFTDAQPERVMPIRPVENMVQSTEKFEGEPTSRSDYKQHDATQPERVKRQSEYSPPTEPFKQSDSTYKETYPGYTVPKRESMKPKEQPVASAAPFDSTTSSREDYKEHPVSARQMREKEEYKPNPIKFDAQSTTKDAYGSYPAVGKSQSFKPEHKPVSSGEKFEGRSTMQEEFRTHPVQPPKPKERAKWQPSGEKMEIFSSNREDFPDHGVVTKAQPIRPTSNSYSSDAKMDNYSTSRQDFKGHTGVERPAPIKAQDSYRPPEGRFEGHTTTRDAFQGYQPGTKRESFKPLPQAVSSGAPFVASTENRTAYGVKPANVCPAAKLDSAAFRSEDPTGHRFYEVQSRLDFASP